MGRIVILTHELDRERIERYLVSRLARHWRAWGHEVLVRDGRDDPPPADLAILHVDLTVVPSPLLAIASRYPVVVNGAVRDVSKRRVSRNLLGPDDPWSGEVIVKPDLNAGGGPEWRHYRAAPAGRGLPAPRVPPPGGESYYLFGRLALVPRTVWSNPDWVVERFLPEREGGEYCARTWVFFGDHERCSRYRGSGFVVKASSIQGKEVSHVPDEMRAERERLGFDFGKFDFVIHDGVPVLLDANRTPGAPPDSLDAERGNADLARGIERFLGAGA